MTLQYRDRRNPRRQPARGRKCRRLFDRGALLVLAGAVSVVLAGCTAESSTSSTAAVSVPVPSVTVGSVSTSTTTTTALSTPTTETTTPTDLGDSVGKSVLGRGAPTTPLWKLAHQVANAMDGVDGRNVGGQGETTNFVEEAAFGYRSESGVPHDVWLFFDPPDEESSFFSGDPLVEVATEDSVVGPVVFYKARTGSESIAPAGAMVLVCDDTVQLWVLSVVSPVDARDEAIAVAGFVDCTSMDS